MQTAKHNYVHRITVNRFFKRSTTKDLFGDRSKEEMKLNWMGYILEERKKDHKKEAVRILTDSIWYSGAFKRQVKTMLAQGVITEILMGGISDYIKKGCVYYTAKSRSCDSFCQYGKHI